MKKRSEVEQKYTWKLEDMISGDEVWEERFGKMPQTIGEYRAFAGTLGESPEQLRACLDFDNATSLELEILFVYARMRSDEDTANQRYQEMTGRIQSLCARAAQESAFVVPEILAIPKERLEGFLKEETLKPYRRLLEMILSKREHTLSPEMEELLAQSQEATEGAAQIFNMFNNADVRFPEILGENGETLEITHGSYIALMESPNRRIRKEAFEGLYSVYRQYRNTLAAAFSANVKQAVFYAKARRYDSSRQYYLSQNEIPEQVYDNLLDAVHENLPLLHRYMKVRKDVLGLDELHMYDLYVPMVSEFDRSYSYEEAKQMVLEGLKPLGEAYGKVLCEGFEKRWVDVYENEGKRSGAYSWGAYGTHPYVLMNFHGTLNDVFTLAHEMGHSMHSYYSDSAQPYVYAGYKIFVAEVASTCNEALLIRHLLGKAKDDCERKYLLNHFLESFRTTLFRQTMFAEFENEAHKMAADGQTLTAGALSEIYHRLNADYFGPEMVVDAEIDHEWERIPHFYTPFYVYQYATGFSAAVAISSKILAGEESALEGYKKFLQGGCSMPPIELLKLCGVDMSSTKPVNDALKVFGELLEEFEKLQA